MVGHSVIHWCIVLWLASPAPLFTCWCEWRTISFGFVLLLKRLYFWKSYSPGTIKSSKATVKMVWRLPLSSKILHLNHCLTNKVNELEESNFTSHSQRIRPRNTSKCKTLHSYTCFPFEQRNAKHVSHLFWSNDTDVLVHLHVVINVTCLVIDFDHRGILINYCLKVIAA